MSGKSINFDDKKINKSTFYKNKKLFNIHDLDVNKILVSKKESYGTKNSLKYFIGYNDDVIGPLCIKVPQMIGYVKHFDSNKTLHGRRVNFKSGCRINGQKGTKVEKVEHSFQNNNIRKIFLSALIYHINRYIYMYIMYI